MNNKQVVASGVCAGIVMFVIGMIAGTLTGDYYMLAPQLWKPMTDTWFVQVLALDLVVGLVFAYIFLLIQKSVPGESWKRGLNFGLLVWLVRIVPGMGMTYLSMTVPTIIIVAWIIGALVSDPLMGITIAIVSEKVK